MNKKSTFYEPCLLQNLGAAYSSWIPHSTGCVRKKLSGQIAGIKLLIIKAICNF
jgi:hypothetical protein